MEWLSGKMIAVFLAGGVAGGAVGAVATSIATSSSESTATASSAAICEPSEQVIMTAIKENPGLCPKPEDTLLIPTDDEATQAFQNRVNPLAFTPGPTKDIVRLGNCTKGTITAIQCAADIDFGGNGQFQQRMIGFDKSPSGWLAKLL